jgi:hypothetical protein
MEEVHGASMQGREKKGVRAEAVGGGRVWAAAARARRRRAAVGQHAHAGAGEREAGWWAGLWGGVPLAMEMEGMTGGARLRKENKEKNTD